MCARSASHKPQEVSGPNELTPGSFNCNARKMCQGRGVGLVSVFLCGDSEKKLRN